MDLLPRDFPKWAEPEIFGLQSVEESGLAINFIRKLPRPILKTEIVRRTLYSIQSLEAKSTPGRLAPKMISSVMLFMGS
jgi:hypothetical protein